MKGWIYRTAVRMKDAGERLHWQGLAQAGLILRDYVLNTRMGWK